MGSQPVTTNPLLIMIINMTVVFAVLYGLSLIIRLIKIIDPTQKKRQPEPAVTPAPATVTAPEPAPAATAAQDDAALVAVIAAAIAAYGYGVAQIASIRRIDGQAWAQAGRLDAVNTRAQMY